MRLGKRAGPRHGPGPQVRQFPGDSPTPKMLTGVRGPHSGLTNKHELCAQRAPNRRAPKPKHQTALSARASYVAHLIMIADRAVTPGVSGFEKCDNMMMLRCLRMLEDALSSQKGPRY